nr:hypothetical protein Iba_chr04cCG6600 [Ipomoea batatas]GMD33440.1 hypothetical protein Iba_chr09cCG2590 [Ipomoea batatas]GMD37726.1 hypothetical protein Iba_chr09eCG12140 [Ipomoea batatas]GMD39234.1 hypothetical protein Iba_chr09fCG11660 [Ipomoea batatas]
MRSQFSAACRPCRCPHATADSYLTPSHRSLKGSLQHAATASSLTPHVINWVPINHYGLQIYTVNYLFYYLYSVFVKIRSYFVKVIDCF